MPFPQDKNVRRTVDGQIGVPLVPGDATHAVAKSYVDGRMPTGALIQYAGAAAPTGWLLCDGSSKLVATYPDLFAAIGYQFGGSGANFFVPNAKGRVPVGKDAAQTEFDVLGETGGEKTHTLNNAEMPTHAHTYSTNTSNAVFSTPGGTGMDIRGTNNAVTTTAGGGDPHNNLQPYLTLNFIIKT